MAGETTGAGTGVLASTGPFGALGLIVLMEAGVPIPVPSDLVMLFVGERASSGAVPLWFAVVGIEVATIIGTSAFFFAARGPARAFVHRIGPKIGLKPERVARLTAIAERRGGPALVVGRATPGMRTASVVASALSDLPARRALPPLLIGATIFVQLHIVLGYVLGAAAAPLFEKASRPALVALVVLALIGGVFWFLRKRRRAESTVEAAHDWTEACCPVCLALGAVVPSVVADLKDDSDLVTV